MTKRVSEEETLLPVLPQDVLEYITSFIEPSDMDLLNNIVLCSKKSYLLVENIVRRAQEIIQEGIKNLNLYCGQSSSTHYIVNMRKKVFEKYAENNVLIAGIFNFILKDQILLVKSGPYRQSQFFTFLTSKVTPVSKLCSTLVIILKLHRDVFPLCSTGGETSLDKIRIHKHTRLRHLFYRNTLSREVTPLLYHPLVKTVHFPLKREFSVYFDRFLDTVVDRRQRLLLDFYYKNQEKNPRFGDNPYALFYFVARDSFKHHRPRKDDALSDVVIEINGEYHHIFSTVGKDLKNSLLLYTGVRSEEFLYSMKLFDHFSDVIKLIFQRINK
jgi:hypothetical protein